MKSRPRLTPEMMDMFFRPHLSKAAREKHSAQECAALLEEGLEENPKLDYNETLFVLVCNEIDHASEIKTWMRSLYSGSTMAEMLAAIPWELRRHFLKTYICRFKQMLTI